MKGRWSSNRSVDICREARFLDDWPLQTVEFEEFMYDADVREGLKNKEILANPVFQISIDNNLVEQLEQKKELVF